MVELGEVPQQPGQSSVVSATPNEAHAEDGIAGNGGVTVVGELAQRIEDGQLRVGGREEGEGQGDGTTNDGVTVVKLCVCVCVCVCVCGQSQRNCWLQRMSVQCIFI